MDALTFSQKKESRQRAVSWYKLVGIQFFVPSWVVYTWGLIVNLFYTLLGSLYLRVIFNLLHILLNSCMEYQDEIFYEFSQPPLRFDDAMLTRNKVFNGEILMRGMERMIWQ